MSLVDDVSGAQSQQLAVLYCDISHTEVRPPESEIALWRVNYFRAARVIAADHGGHETVTAAGGWIATFISTVEALVCARELSALVGWQTGGPNLSGGLSAGEVIREPYGIAGSPVYEAIALCRRARPRQVLVADPLKVVVAPDTVDSFAPAPREARADEEPPRPVTQIDRAGRHGYSGRFWQVDRRLDTGRRPPEPPLRLLTAPSSDPATPLGTNFPKEPGAAPDAIAALPRTPINAAVSTATTTTTTSAPNDARPTVTTTTTTMAPVSTQISSPAGGRAPDAAPVAGTAAPNGASAGPAAPPATAPRAAPAAPAGPTGAAPSTPDRIPAGPAATGAAPSTPDRIPAGPAATGAAPSTPDRIPAAPAATGAAPSTAALGAAPAHPTSPGLRLTVLGWVQLEIGEPPVRRAIMRGTQARSVLSMLALRRGPVHKEELAELLWPGALPEHWEGALRGLVTKIRRFLDEGDLPAREALIGEGGYYELRLPQGVTVDRHVASAYLAEAEATLALGRPAEAATVARRALTILERRLMSGLDDAWFDQVRAELAGERVTALELCARADLAAGCIEAAKRAASEALALDPYRESSYRLLMEAHATAGSRGEALRSYERCRRVLAEELGVGPANQTQDLYLRLLG